MHPAMIGKQRIVVVGGGVIGAALAWSLARRGAAVTLLERDRPAAGATGRAFAWIGHGHLGPLAREEWRRIGPSLPGLAIDWCGALTWGADPAESEYLVAEREGAGQGIRLVEGDEIRRLEPGLEAVPPLAA